MRRTTLLLSATALMVGLTACAPEQEAEDVPAEVLPTETATPEPTPTEAAPKPLTIPACIELVDLAAMKARDGGNWMVWSETIEGETYHQMVMGPSAQAALESSRQSTFCEYAVPNSDTFIEILVAELDPESKDSLVADLRKSDYAESELVPSVPVFDYAMETLPGPVPIRHVFVENAWIITVPDRSDTLAVLALEGLRAVNPDLEG